MLIYKIIKYVRSILIFMFMFFSVCFITTPIAKSICMLLTILLSLIFSSILPFAFQMFKLSGGLYNLYIYNCKLIAYFYAFLIAIIITHLINYYIQNGVENNDINK